MNDRLKTKTSKIMASLSQLNNHSNAVKEEAVGFFLAFEEELPSSEMATEHLAIKMTETSAIASYLAENSMLSAQNIYKHAVTFYELRNKAAFNSVLFAASMARGKVAFSGEAVYTAVAHIVRCNADEKTAMTGTEIAH